MQNSFVKKLLTISLLILFLGTISFVFPEKVEATFRCSCSSWSLSAPLVCEGGWQVESGTVSCETGTVASATACTSACANDPLCPEGESVFNPDAYLTPAIQCSAPVAQQQPLSCASNVGRNSCFSGSYPVCFEGLASAGVSSYADCDCTEFGSGGGPNLCLFQSEDSYQAALPVQNPPNVPDPTLPALCEPCANGACGEGQCLNAVCLPLFSNSGENGPCFYNGDCADGLTCEGGGYDVTQNYCSSNATGRCVAADFPEPTYNCANPGGQCNQEGLKLSSCEDNVFRSDCSGFRTCWINPNRNDGLMDAGTGPGSCAQLEPVDPAQEGEEEPLGKFAFCSQVPAGSQRDACVACVGDEENSSGDHVYTAVGCIRTGGSGLTEDLIRMLMGVSGGVALLSILAGAFLFTVSQGDASKLKEAKALITAAVTGLFFIIFSIFILQFIGVSILQIPGLGGGQAVQGPAPAPGGGAGNTSIRNQLNQIATADENCGQDGQGTCIDPSQDDTWGLNFCDPGFVEIIDSSGSRVCSTSEASHRATTVYYGRTDDPFLATCEWDDNRSKEGSSIPVFDTLRECQLAIISARENS